MQGAWEGGYEKAQDRFRFDLEGINDNHNHKKNTQKIFKVGR